MKTNKFFERKDVIDSLKQMRTSPTSSSADETFIYGLLVVMKTMIDTVNLEESDTTIARSLIESIINQRSKEVSLDKQSTVLKAITESFERKQNKREENRISGKAICRNTSNFTRYRYNQTGERNRYT
ncbi:hypothetical protein ACJMK2_012510 [Sinanodonta woodiana]|uniref:Uncharacterized protein n=1 Tax=Sinanodonta woodiana TaxID=1069815 RepID=A0ABD3VA27_SINWO